MLALLPIIASVAPEIIGLFAGSKSSSMLSKVAEIAQSIFGTNDPATIQSQLSTDAAKLDAFKTALMALAESDRAQDTVNAAEATNSSLFVAGWRPFIGWVCGCGLAYQFLAHPLLLSISASDGW